MALDLVGGHAAPAALNLRLQPPTTPPSALRTATTAERGRPLGLYSGQLENRCGWAGSVRSLGVSPGC